MQMQIRRAQPSESRLTRDWITQGHYLDEGNAIFACVLEFWAKREQIGAMVLGAPHAPGYDREKVMELYRVYFVDGTDAFVESQGLAMMRKFVRIWYPAVRLLISYSDPSKGHRGTIYDADGWCPLGMTKADKTGGWSRHKGRLKSSRAIESKLRWVRTP